MTSTAQRAGQAEADGTLAAACDRLLALQHPDGWWKGELETNVTMDAEDLLLRQFVGIRTEPETSRAAVWIRSQQRADGTWAVFTGGPPDPSTTIDAYLPLRPARGRPHPPPPTPAPRCAPSPRGSRPSPGLPPPWR